MKEQGFLAQEVRHGRGVTFLSRDKTEVSHGVGEGGECRKMDCKCLGKMTLNSRAIWNIKSSD